MPNSRVVTLKRELPKDPTKKRPKKAGIKSAEAIEDVKTSRARKGNSWITEYIPTEVFTEMASHLLPLDLLQMSRTSRAIRHILMSKRSVFVWRRALKNHPTPLPDLEQHPSLNEPQFFALVFDQYCQSCWSKSRKTHPYYTMLVRLCDNCFQNFTMAAPDIVNTYFGVYTRDSPMAAMVPLASPTKDEMRDFIRALNSGSVSTGYDIKGLSVSYNNNRRRFPQEEFIRIHEELRRQGFRQEKRDEFAMEQARIVSRIYSFASAMLDWQSEESKRLDRMREEEELVWEMSVFEKLRDLGYKHDDLQIDPRVNAKLARRWTKLTRQSRPLTERIWQNLQPKLENIILENRKNVQKHSTC